MSVVEPARRTAGGLDFVTTADPLDPSRVNSFKRWESLIRVNGQAPRQGLVKEGRSRWAG